MIDKWNGSVKKDGDKPQKRWTEVGHPSQMLEIQEEYVAHWDPEDKWRST